MFEYVAVLTCSHFGMESHVFSYVGIVCSDVNLHWPCLIVAIPNDSTSCQKDLMMSELTKTSGARVDSSSCAGQETPGARQRVSFWAWFECLHERGVRERVYKQFSLVTRVAPSFPPRWEDSSAPGLQEESNACQ